MISPAIFEAVVSAYTAEQSYVATLNPEKRAAYRARRAEEQRKRQAEHDEMTLRALSLEIRQRIEQKRREALERLDREPEVVLAQECIAREGLVGATAEQLLAFARELALRRAPCPNL